jgi:putative Mg2+ transporter-C (MgtC) family protein
LPGTSRLPQIRVVDIDLRWTRGAAPAEAVLQDLLKAQGLRSVRVGHVVSPDGRLHEHHIKAKGPGPLDIDGLVTRLARRVPKVT